MFTGEAQRVPPQRIRVAERQLGHEVHRRVQHVGARFAAVEVRHDAHLHPCRQVLHAHARAYEPAEGAQGAPNPGASPPPPSPAIVGQLDAARASDTAGCSETVQGGP